MLVCVHLSGFAFSVAQLEPFRQANYSFQKLYQTALSLTDSLTIAHQEVELPTERFCLLELQNAPCVTQPPVVWIESDWFRCMPTNDEGAAA
jgi:hypothetical protein